MPRLPPGRLTSAQATSRSSAQQPGDGTAARSRRHRAAHRRAHPGRLADRGGDHASPLSRSTPRSSRNRPRRSSATPGSSPSRRISTTGKTEPTDAQKAAAKKIADQALADDHDGRQDAGGRRQGRLDRRSKASGGDLGWIDKDAAEDPVYIDAVFAARRRQADRRPRRRRTGPTGSVASPRSPRPSVDQAWTDEARRRRAQARGRTARSSTSEVIRQALDDKIVADATSAGKQRQVQELSIQAPADAAGRQGASRSATSSSRRRTIRSGASALPGDDPAWTEARARRPRPRTTRSRPTRAVRRRSPATRATRPRPRATTGPAASCRTSTSERARSTRSSPTRSSRPGLKPGDLLAARQERLRLARHPDHVPARRTSTR